VGRRIEDFLHGKWLGHPLHSALTDIPIGAWTTAVIFDAVDAVSGKENFRSAAGVAIATGLVGATAAATTGLTDWQRTSGGARRIGLIHGLTNIGGVTLLAGSLIARQRGSRTAGRVLSKAAEQPSRERAA